MKFQCNTSKVHVSNFKCRVKIIGRDESTIQIELEVIKKINQLFADYRGFIKPHLGTSWRQILKFDKINVCASINIAKTGSVGNSDILKAFWKEYYETFHGLPDKCPIERGKYFVRNQTVYNSNDNDYASSHQSDLENTMTPKFPNGIYRHIIRFYNDEDAEGFSAFWHVDRYDKMGEDRF